MVMMVAFEDVGMFPHEVMIAPFRRFNFILSLPDTMFPFLDIGE